MKLLLATVLAFILIFNLQAQTVETTQRLLIEDITVIPMHINKALEHRDVILENGIIKQVRQHTDQDSSNYSLGRVDGRGKFLVPSFSDAHVHFPKKKDIKRVFLMNLMAGVTTLRSMRGEAWHLDMDKEAAFTPRLFLSTPVISRNDSFSVQMAHHLLAEYKKSGYDFVKIMSVKDQNTFDYLVGAARKYQLPLAGHCPSNLGIFTLSNSGVFQSVEHLGGFFALKTMEEIQQAVDASLAKNVYHCPTFGWNYTGQVENSELRTRTGVEFIPATWIKDWEAQIAEHEAKTSEEGRAKERSISAQRFESRLQYLGFIYRQGGQLILGADASGIYGIPGFGAHAEMQHFADAEVSNYDILKATCYNLSKLFGEEKTWGTIKVGCQSDLVLLNANPLEDIKNTSKIEGIVFKGKYYTQAALKKQLDQLKE
jgi:hypothetical protein